VNNVQRPVDAGELPALPPADKQGRRPALAFVRASIARSIVEERRAAGLSQEELARLAGLRQETVCRIESGKHSPTVRTVAKIDKALQAALARTSKRAKAKERK
jgi:ribosome-binding protein aMBF1 (putative translation factor)